APLKPFSEWPRGMTKAKLINQIKTELKKEFVGVDFNFSQNIEDNVEEAVSGVKGENSVKLYGPELDVLEKNADAIKAQLESVLRSEDLGAVTEHAQPNLLIQVDRLRCARYGVAPADGNSIVQAAIGGQAVTDIFEGERHFPLVARLLPEYRQDIDAIRRIVVPTPGGAQVPLRELADIKLRSGASYIYREGNERYIPIKFSVRGRDLGGAIAEAQSRIAGNVRLPAGYRADWSGEFGELKEAEARLMYIVPISILLIVILLYGAFNNLRDCFLVI